MTSFRNIPFVALSTALLLAACGQDEPTAEVPRPVRTVELRYDTASDASRYFGAVEARHEVAQAFRVGGKIMERHVDVGESVEMGDLIALLDDVDYRLTEEATSQQLEAARARLRQAESDWKRMQGLKLDGSVSASEDEHAETELRTARAAVEAEARKLELARNQVEYTVLRASGSGVVTSAEFEVGQVVAAGQPGIAIANQSEPEIVINVPEDHLEAFKNSRYRVWLTSAPNESFEVVLRELAAQATPQTRTYRARLKPATPRPLPLGASATLLAERVAAGPPVATIPASAITQSEGQPALWAVQRGDAESIGTVELIRVVVLGYRNDEILISGAPSGALIVTAGVQKMAPGLRVALPQNALVAIDR